MELRLFMRCSQPAWAEVVASRGDFVKIEKSKSEKYKGKIESDLKFCVETRSCDGIKPC